MTRDVQTVADILGVHVALSKLPKEGAKCIFRNTLGKINSAYLGSALLTFAQRGLQHTSDLRV